MIGAATAMATKRAARRRTTTPGRKVAPPDLGTEQTRARLQPPPWADWPEEIQRTMELIREIICWQAGGSTAQAQDLLHVRHHASGHMDEDEETWRASMERRYDWWRWELIRHHRWTALAITLVFVDGIIIDPSRMREAVELFHKTPRRVWAA